MSNISLVHFDAHCDLSVPPLLSADSVFSKEELFRYFGIIRLSFIATMFNNYVEQQCRSLLKCFHAEVVNMHQVLIASQPCQSDLHKFWLSK